MRTNIVIDDKLMQQAMMASGATTKRQVVELALQQLVAEQKYRQAYEAVRKLRGTLTDDDWWDNGDSNC